MWLPGLLGRALWFRPHSFGTGALGRRPTFADCIHFRMKWNGSVNLDVQAKVWVSCHCNRHWPLRAFFLRLLPFPLSCPWLEMPQFRVLH